MGGKRAGISVSLLAVAVALAAVGSAKGFLSNLPVVVNGGFWPKTLPKGKPAHVVLEIAAKAPALTELPSTGFKEVDLDLDRNVTVDAKGLPACRPTRGEIFPPPGIQACRPALVGKGRMMVEIEFPESKPINITSKLLAFNGGVKGGMTTIRLYAFLPSPVSAAVVTTLKVTKEQEGHYGSRWALAFPTVAGGLGRVREFRLRISRRFSFGGKRRSYLLARCTDGTLRAKTKAVFSEGTTFEGHFVRACTPRGSERAGSYSPAPSA